MNLSPATIAAGELASGCLKRRLVPLMPKRAVGVCSVTLTAPVIVESIMLVAEAAGFNDDVVLRSGLHHDAIVDVHEGLRNDVIGVGCLRVVVGEVVSSVDQGWHSVAVDAKDCEVPSAG